MMADRGLQVREFSIVTYIKAHEEKKDLTWI